MDNEIYRLPSVTDPAVRKTLNKLNKTMYQSQDHVYEKRCYYCGEYADSYTLKSVQYQNNGRLTLRYMHYVCHHLKNNLKIIRGRNK